LFIEVTTFVPLVKWATAVWLSRH